MRLALTSALYVAYYILLPYFCHHGALPVFLHGGAPCCWRFCTPDLIITSWPYRFARWFTRGIGYAATAQLPAHLYQTRTAATYTTLPSVAPSRSTANNAYLLSSFLSHGMLHVRLTLSMTHSLMRCTKTRRLAAAVYLFSLFSLRAPPLLAFISLIFSCRIAITMLSAS